MKDIVLRARQLRIIIEKIAEISLDDEQALEAVELFPSWDGNEHEYVIGDRVRYNDILYKVLQNHISQTGWTPDISSSLFAKILIPDSDIIPNWEQPLSTNTYMKNDKVKHNNKIWISLYDYNSWQPGVFGWEEIIKN